MCRFVISRQQEGIVDLSGVQSGVDVRRDVFLQFVHKEVGKGTRQDVAHREASDLFENLVFNTQQLTQTFFLHLSTHSENCSTLSPTHSHTPSCLILFVVGVIHSHLATDEGRSCRNIYCPH